MRRRPSEEWVARLEKVGVPCAPINDITHMKAHPQTAALGMVQPVPEIDLDLMSLPLSFDGERPVIRTRAPEAGRAQRRGAGPAQGQASPGLTAGPAGCRGHVNRTLLEAGPTRGVRLRASEVIAWPLPSTSICNEAQPISRYTACWFRSATTTSIKLSRR